MYRITYFFLLGAFLSSCVLLPTPEFKVGDEALQLQEITKMIDDRFYEQAVQRCQEFMKKFPKSKSSDVVLLRLGQAFEGLVEEEYHQVVRGGAAAEIAKKQFLEKYGHYQCWVEKPEGVFYDRKHYQEMRDKFPESNYADEAAYHLIPWVYDYQGLPEGSLKEIGYLEKVLQDYPTTSLKPELYYQIGYRLQILYEIYAFSPDAALRSAEEAKKYREKALYFYRLVLTQPTQSKFSRSAWEALKGMEEGKRVYLKE